MPAITVEDVLVLPRLPTLDPATTRVREVRRLVTAPRGYEGEGFLVHRGFADVPLSELDPFVHFDQVGEVDLGLAAHLVQQALTNARAAGKRIVPVCPYVANFLKKHDEFAGITDPATSELLQRLDGELGDD